MTHTSYPYTTALPAPFWNGYTDQDASGTGTRILDVTHWSPTSFGAAGQIVSNLADMRIWAQAVGAGALLSKAAFRAHLTPNPSRSKAGGIRVRHRRGHGWITHAGTVPGFNSDFGYLPKLGASIVVSPTDIDEPDSAPRRRSSIGAVGSGRPDDVSRPQGPRSISVAAFWEVARMRLKNPAAERGPSRPGPRSAVVGETGATAATNGRKVPAYGTKLRR